MQMFSDHLVGLPTYVDARSGYSFLLVRRYVFYAFDA